MRRMILFFLLAALSVSFLPVPAPAQDYPTKAITMICGFAAGGTTDLSARKLAELARKYLNNQPIVVETKAGGAGTVGTIALAGAKPDGYTISAVAYSPLVLIPHMRKVSYDAKKDF